MGRPARLLSACEKADQLFQRAVRQVPLGTNLRTRGENCRRTAHLAGLNATRTGSRIKADCGGHHAPLKNPRQVRRGRQKCRQPLPHVSQYVNSS